MKLFKSAFLAVLGVAVALTSCSDDNKYEPGNKAPGAYFDKDMSAEVYISTEATSFEVPVYRTEDAPLSFSLQSIDESGLFTIPSNVTFAEGKTAGTITIGYNPEKLEEAHPYEISLTVGDGTAVGRNTVNLVVSMQTPMVTEPYEEGAGIYYYHGFWEGRGESPITVSYMPANPNNVTWTISDWGEGTDLLVTCDDLSATDSYGDRIINVPIQSIGYTHSEYGPVYVADAYNWYLYQIQSATTAESYKEASYYTKETGTFNLYLVYYVPEYGEGTSYFTKDYEMFQLYGYPEYGVTVAYDGLFTDRQQNMTAMGTVTSEADVDVVKVVMVEGKDPQVGINAILSDAEGVQEVAGATTAEVKFPITKGGQYTLVAVSFDSKGEAQDYAADSFEIMLSNDNADWSDYGTADFADGWVIGAFSINGVPLDVNEWAFPVLVQKSHAEGNEGDVYRLVKPYGDEFPLAANNAYPASRNIAFNIVDHYVGILPQLCGFGASSWGGEMTIGNAEGMYMSEEGLTLAEVGPGIKAEFQSSYEDGLVTVPLPIWGLPVYDNEFGYNWKEYQASWIALPDAPAAVVAKAKAARVAAPAVKAASAKAVSPKASAKKSDFLKGGRVLRTYRPGNDVAPASLRRH